MNVLIEDESKKNKRLKIFYIGILAVCAIAIIAAVIIQIVKVNTSSGDVSKLPQLTEDQKSQHKEIQRKNQGIKRRTEKRRGTSEARK